MKSSNLELPSNKKFGYFFTLIFGISATFFYINSSVELAFGFATAFLLFLTVTYLRAGLLLPLNKLWMRFGLLLGMLVSPVVLGIIFFGLFTPIALLMRLVGRDALWLKFENKDTYWISRNKLNGESSFKDQF